MDCWKIESRGLEVVAPVGREMKLTSTCTTRAASAELSGNASRGWLIVAGRLASKPQKRKYGVVPTWPTGPTSVREVGVPQLTVSDVPDPEYVPGHVCSMIWPPWT